MRGLRVLRNVRESAKKIIGTRVREKLRIPEIDRKFRRSNTIKQSSSVNVTVQNDRRAAKIRSTSPPPTYSEDEIPKFLLVSLVEIPAKNIGIFIEIFHVGTEPDADRTIPSSISGTGPCPHLQKHDGTEPTASYRRQNNDRSGRELSSRELSSGNSFHVTSPRGDQIPVLNKTIWLCTSCSTDPSHPSFTGRFLGRAAAALHSVAFLRRNVQPQDTLKGNHEHQT